MNLKKTEITILAIMAIFMCLTLIGVGSIMFYFSSRLTAPVVTVVVAVSPPPVDQQAVIPTALKLTREQVIEARRKFQVEVLSFDATQEFGTEFPYSDYVRLQITNGADVVLPNLTVLTKRFDGQGKMIGSSRAPAISVADLKPGQTAEVDYYPRGHLPGVRKITVEIETLIAPGDEQFFAELPK